MRPGHAGPASEWVTLGVASRMLGILTLVARQRGFDVEATVELMVSAETVMDRMLVAAMAGHRIGRCGTSHEGRDGRARRRSDRTPQAGPIA